MQNCLNLVHSEDLEDMREYYIVWEIIYKVGLTKPMNNFSTCWKSIWHLLSLCHSQSTLKIRTFIQLLVMFLNLAKCANLTHKSLKNTISTAQSVFGRTDFRKSCKPFICVFWRLNSKQHVTWYKAFLNFTFRLWMITCMPQAGTAHLIKFQIQFQSCLFGTK